MIKEAGAAAHKEPQSVSVQGGFNKKIMCKLNFTGKKIFLRRILVKSNIGSVFFFSALYIAILHLLKHQLTPLKTVTGKLKIKIILG